MNPKIKYGIENFVEGHRKKNYKFGIITNAATISPRGLHSWEILLKNGFTIKAIFGPEHGFTGSAQDAVHIADQKYKGIPVYSLYGERTAPREQMLSDIDIMLFDIQDVGSRYYTYLYTLANSLKLCIKKDKKFIILDRPNPISNQIVEGYPIDPKYSSFVGNYKLPNRYGLTIAEYAAYIKGEFFTNADIEYYWMTNYNPRLYFQETGLPWAAPSPNIPTPETALVYAGTCLIEGTNLSEGRGTTRPFETIGAPWIDGEQLAMKMNSFNLPGVIFSSTFFQPVISKFTGTLCQGINIHPTDIRKFKPVMLAIYLLSFIRKEYSDVFKWRTSWENKNEYFIDRLAGTSELRRMIDTLESPDEIYNMYQKGLQDYIEKREKYLHYR